jgi:hypothetical protein
MALLEGREKVKIEVRRPAAEAEAEAEAESGTGTEAGTELPSVRPVCGDVHLRAPRP